MKYITLLLLAALALPAHAVIVFGDSISAGPTSWPHYLKVDHGYHVAVEAMAGRSASNWEPPRDLLPISHGKVVYWLGTNDSRSPLAILYSMAVKQHLHFLLTRGFEVVLVLPPVGDNPALDTTYVRQEALAQCRANQWFAQPIICADPEDIGYSSGTFDGVHPTDDMSRQLAAWIAGMLQ